MSKKIILIGIAILVVIAAAYAAWYSYARHEKLIQAAAGSDKYAAAIIACYPKVAGSSASQPIPNNSVQYLKETSRHFINMPKNLYPKDISHSWTTVAGNATGGYVSNGGLPGEGLDATPGCWSTYVDFEGSGEVDLRVKSVVDGAPDYFVRFIVSPV